MIDMLTWSIFTEFNLPAWWGIIPISVSSFLVAWHILGVQGDIFEEKRKASEEDREIKKAIWWGIIDTYPTCMYSFDIEHYRHRVVESARVNLDCFSVFWWEIKED